jgi:hypothetical protein
MLSLFQVLSFDQRVLVLSSEDTGEIYTWNQSLTLQCWAVSEGMWEEVDVRTLSTEPRNFAEARKRAQDWLFEVAEVDE